MVAVQPLVFEFTLVGRLEDFVVSSKGRVKSLYLSTPEADYTIEVAKEQANILSQYFKPGCYLKVVGMRKNKLHQAQISYKAYSIELLPEQATSSNTVIKTHKSKARYFFLIVKSERYYIIKHSDLYKLVHAHELILI